MDPREEERDRHHEDTTLPGRARPAHTNTSFCITHRIGQSHNMRPLHNTVSQHSATPGGALWALQVGVMAGSPQSQAQHLVLLLCKRGLDYTPIVGTLFLGNKRRAEAIRRVPLCRHRHGPPASPSARHRSKERSQRKTHFLNCYNIPGTAARGPCRKGCAQARVACARQQAQQQRTSEAVNNTSCLLDFL